MELSAEPIFWRLPFSRRISIFQSASISSAPLLRLPACSPAHEMYESGGGGREGGGWWGRGEGRVVGGAWAPANSRIYFSLARGRWDNTGKPQGTSPSLHIFIFQSILFGKSSSGKERAAGKKGIRELQRTLSFKKYFLVMTITILFFITKNIIIKSHHGLRKRRIPWVRWSPGLEGGGEDLSLLLLLRGPLHSDKTTLCSKPPPPVYDSMMQSIKN